MNELFNWRIIRSGAHLTIFGKDAAGKDVKVTGVEEVAVVRHPRGLASQIIATKEGGLEFRLAPPDD